jgi:hypothetical protein
MIAQILFLLGLLKAKPRPQPQSRRITDNPRSAESIHD